MPKAQERSALADLPQYYADMFGWEEMVARIAGIYGTLTPEEQRHTAIFARHYGEAAAIDFFGRSNDVEDSLTDLRSPGRCGEATLGDVTSCEHCMP